MVRRPSAMPWPATAASISRPRSLNWTPCAGSGQSSPAAWNHGRHGSSGLRSRWARASAAGVSNGPARCDVGRRRDRKHRLGEQQLRAARVGVLAAAEAHFDVRLAGLHVEQRDRQVQLELDVRVLLGERGQPRHEDVAREGRRHRDQQAPAGVGARRRQRGSRPASAARAATAYCTACGVSVSGCGRAISGWPSHTSNWRSRWLIALAVTHSSSAAATTLPRRATASSACRQCSGGRRCIALLPEPRPGRPCRGSGCSADRSCA